MPRHSLVTHQLLLSSKGYFQQTATYGDSPNMWKVIQGYNGTPDATSPNKAMSHYGRTTTDIKSKANAFVNHYARVSKLSMLQADSDTNEQFKKRLKAPSIDNESCVPLLLGELQSAIKRQKVKDQLTLTTFHLYFSSHSILWPSRSYYPYLTNHSHFLTAHESGGLLL